MLDLVSSIDFLKNSIDIEQTLRQAANIEWSKGIHDGPMKKAHDEAIKQIMEAAKQLITLA